MKEKLFLSTLPSPNADSTAASDPTADSTAAVDLTAPSTTPPSSTSVVSFTVLPHTQLAHYEAITAPQVLLFRVFERKTAVKF